MLVTVGNVVSTNDLSKGVIAGVILSAIFFVAKISKIQATEYKKGKIPAYRVRGQLFFVSVKDFVDAFDYSIDENKVMVDFSEVHVC